jgi:replication-associated recombination protein RarA
VPQDYLPEELAGTSFYQPGEEGAEPELVKRWQAIRKKGGEPGGGETAGE